MNSFISQIKNYNIVLCNMTKKAGRVNSAGRVKESD